MDKVSRQSDKDLMRVLAAFAVVLLHAASPESGFAFQLTNALTRFCVPLFFMISGSLMLSRDYSPKHLLWKGLRLLLLALVWSGVYLSLSYAVNHTVLTASALLKYLVSEPVHLWYLWSAIGLYLLTPPLRAMCRNAERSVLRYTLILLFVLGCMLFPLQKTGLFPTLSALLSRTHLPLELGFVFCYLFGFYQGESNRNHAPLYAVGFVLCCTASYFLIGVQPDAALSFSSPFNVGAAAFLFLTVRSYNGHLASRIAPLTLGIYLVHAALLVYVFRPLTAGLSHAGLRILCTALGAFVLSALITLVLRLIPPIRKYLI